MTLSKIDQQVAQNLAEFRRKANLTQRTVAEDLGITTQQLSKYENGEDRVSAGRLYRLAELYGVSIVKFYKGLTKGAM